jgi:REP element-mobilizing transposase RayT
MTRASGKHHRRSLRLQGYDYSQPGAYFVTICTQNNAYLFGDIVDGEMLLNDAGQMVRAVWNELARNYPGIGIDTFVIMPNHIHGIITIHSPAVGAGPRTCPSLRARRGHRPPPGNHRGLPLR